MPFAGWTETLLWAAAAVVAVGSFAALMLRRRRKLLEEARGELDRRSAAREASPARRDRG